MEVGYLKTEVSRTYCPNFKYEDGAPLMVTWKPHIELDEVPEVLNTDKLTIKYICSLSGKETCDECSKDENLKEDIKNRLPLLS